MTHPLYRWEEFHLRQALTMLGARSWMFPLLAKRTHRELLAFHQAFVSVLLAPCDVLPEEPTSIPDEQHPRTFDEKAPAALPAGLASQPSSPTAEGPRRVRPRRPTPVFPR